MKKKSITFLVMALLTIVEAKAVVIPSRFYSEPAAGTYYLYNISKGKFLDAYLDLVDNPTMGMILEAQTGSTYSLTPNDGLLCIKMGSNGTQFIWRNDNFSGHCGQKWSFSEDGTTKTYYLSITADQNYDNYFINGQTYYLNNMNSVTTEQASADKWALITEANFYSYKASAAFIPAQYYTTTVTEGTYYLYSPYSSCFLYPTSDHAGLKTSPESVTITANGNGFDIQFSNGGYLKYDAVDAGNTWANGTTGEAWEFTSFHGVTGLFFIKHVTANSYLYSKTTGAAAWGGECWGTPDSYITKYAWALISDADYNTFITSAEGHMKTIMLAKGDATSLISNPTFDSSAEGWTGGNRTNCNTWRGNDGWDYESSTNSTFSQALSNMPAGRYKLVGAVRGHHGTTATAQLNGTRGTTIENGEFNESRQQINLNGVQMPYSRLGGFNTEWNAKGWQWATATYELVADGDLTISFEMTGYNWKGLDDVHLYYMGDGTNTYAMEYVDGIDVADHVVTCDLQTDNPNKIFTASWNIYTASGDILNNLRVSNGFINNLVLYDGYELSVPENTKAVSSTLYRNIVADSFATICCPFAITGGNGVDGTFYQPESLDDAGVLNFETVETKAAGKSYLYKASSAVTKLTGPHDGILATDPIDNGTGVVMKGTFSAIPEITYGDYVLSGTNLYKVNSTVTCKPFRAYFSIPSSEESPARISFNFGVATAIDEMGNSMPSNSQWFDLQGRRVSQPTHGLFIMNGTLVSLNKC